MGFEGRLLFSPGSIAVFCRWHSEGYNPRVPATLRIRIGEDWSAKEFAGYMRSLSDLYDIYASVTRALAEDRSVLSGVRFHTSSDGIRVPVLVGAPGDTLQVVRVEYASPGLSDFAGLGKAMEEFNKLLLGIFDRVTSSRKRKMELKAQEFELAEKKEKSERDAEVHREKVMRERLENRRLNAQVVREELTLFQELYNNAAFRSNPQAFNQLLDLATKRGSILVELVQAGKITAVEATIKKNGKAVVKRTPKATKTASAGAERSRGLPSSRSSHSSEATRLRVGVLPCGFATSNQAR
jgi:hypothetical protein